MIRLSALSGGSPRWLPPVLFSVLAVVILWPLASLVVTALTADPAVWGERSTWRATRNSLTGAGLATLVALMLGGGAALVFALSDLRGRRALGFLFMVPMMIPPQVTALAWVQMAGPSSPLLKAVGLAPPLGSPQPFYSLPGIAFLLGVQAAPIVYLTLRTGLAAVPQGLVEAARLAGARPARVLTTVILPIARPTLVAAAAIAFTASIGNFGIPAILGIPGGITMLPTLIYQTFASTGPAALGAVAHLSILIALIAALGIVAQRLARGPGARLVGDGGGLPALFRLGRWHAPVAALVWLVLGTVLVLPFLSLLAASLVPAFGVPLTPQTATLDAYAELGRQSLIREAARNSVLLATGAAVLLAGFALPLAWWLDRQPARRALPVMALVDMPYALPGIVIGVALILTHAAPRWGVTLYGTIWIILLAYLCAYMAVALKPVGAAVTRIHPGMEEAARLAGARWGQRMRHIVLPLTLPAMGAAGLLVFLIAVHELTVSALLWSSGSRTLGVALYNLEDSGLSNVASALAVVIVVASFGLLAVLELMGGRLPKGVLPWRV